MLSIILGPRTRLACALLSTDWARQHTQILVARDEADAEWLGTRYPFASVLRAWESVPELLSGDQEIVLFCCALGRPHPFDPNPASDMEVVERDLKVLNHIVHACLNMPLHIVLASSVLALSPPRRRVYYAGWKCVIDGALERVAQSHPMSKVSVVYPGRLVERKTLSRPITYLHTSYKDLAAKLINTTPRSKPQRMLVGLDACLWLAVQGVSTWRVSAFGKM